MKKVLASLMAIVLLVCFTIWWRGYVHAAVVAMDKTIDQAIAALMEQDNAQGQECLAAAMESWEQAEGVLALFLSQSLTDSIDLNFERAKASLELGEINLAITELRTARHMLHDLENSLAVSWRNVI